MVERLRNPAAHCITQRASYCSGASAVLLRVLRLEPDRVPACPCADDSGLVQVLLRWCFLCALVAPSPLLHKAGCAFRRISAKKIGFPRCGIARFVGNNRIS